VNIKEWISEYNEEAMIDSAPQDWVQGFIKNVKNNIGKK